VVSQVQALAAGRTGQRVIMERGDDRNPRLASEQRQIKGQVQEAVEVKNIRLDCAQHVSQLGTQARGLPCI
jgi:hypothetical protein